MNDERTLGEHGARIAALERRLEKIDTNVELLLQQVAEARGGWKGIMALAGFASALGAAATWIAQHLWTR